MITLESDLRDAMETCIFCAIANGEAPASLVHEDEHTLSFVDLRQFNPGHVLVIQVYPSKPHRPSIAVREEYAAAIRGHL